MKQQAFISVPCWQMLLPVPSDYTKGYRTSSLAGHFWLRLCWRTAAITCCTPLSLWIPTLLQVSFSCVILLMFLNILKTWFFSSHLPWFEKLVELVWYVCYLYSIWQAYVDWSIFSLISSIIRALHSLATFFFFWDLSLVDFMTSLQWYLEKMVFHLLPAQGLYMSSHCSRHSSCGEIIIH